MKIDKKYLIYLLIIPNLIFLTLVLSLGFFNRFTSDDIGFIYYGNKNGILSDTLKFYFTWDGRFFIQYFNRVFTILLQDCKTLFPFTLITITSLIISIFLLFSNLSKYILKEKPPKFFIFLFSVLFCCFFFYLTFNVGETWFWIAGTNGYLWPIITLLFGVSILVSKNNKKFIVISCVMFFIFGFSAIPYLAITILFYFIYLIYRIVKESTYNKRLIFKEQFPVLIPFLFFLLGAVLMIIAPGNYQRRESFEPALNIIDIYYESFSSLKHFAKVILLDKLIYGIVFTVAFIILGTFQKSNIKWNNKQVIWIIFVAFILTLSAFIIHSIIMAISTGGIGQPRTWTFLSFIMSAFCVIVGFCLGNYIWSLKPGFAQGIYVISIIIIAVFNMNMLIEQFPITCKYAQSYDRRTDYMNQLKFDVNNNKKIIYLEPLASSGILFSQELARDTSDSFNYSYNKVFKEFYGLNFRVLVKN